MSANQRTMAESFKALAPIEQAAIDESLAVITEQCRPEIEALQQSVARAQGEVDALIASLQSPARLSPVQRRLQRVARQHRPWRKGRRMMR